MKRMLNRIYACVCPFWHCTSGRNAGRRFVGSGGSDCRLNVNRRDSNPASTRRNARRWFCDFQHESERNDCVAHNHYDSDRSLTDPC